VAEVEPTVEAEPEPVAEAEPPKTPRKTTTKRATSRAPAKRKVKVHVEELGTNEEVQETEEPTTPDFSTHSAADQLAMHWAQQRAQQKREKSNRYKALLAGAL
jgi:hypothetical protein